MTAAGPGRDSAASATAATAITDRLNAHRSDRLLGALRREFMVDTALVTIVDLERRQVAIAGVPGRRVRTASR